MTFDEAKRTVHIGQYWETLDGGDIAKVVAIKLPESGNLFQLYAEVVYKSKDYKPSILPSGQSLQNWSIRFSKQVNG